jgi:ABC-type phosphate transport system substrate-binding protein
MGAESVSLTAVVMPTSADVVAFVARNPEAIGYVSQAYVSTPLESESKSTPDALPLNTESDSAKVKVIALEGRLPTHSEIKDGSYPLSTPLFLVGRGELDGWERQLIEFILGPAGQQIVEKFHARVR